jgi:8-oxo-dGTP pyrophosphatase MutT (NUDIX family)
MSDTIRNFFSSLSPIAEDEVAWLGGSIRLRLRVYLTERMPALDIVTSVRAILVTDAGCAVLSNADGFHVLPGGRRKAGEAPSETLYREILEETGCSLTSVRHLGLLHFHHLTAKPAGYAYPYPDFVQPVFVARGERGSFAGDPDRYESTLDFVVPSALEAIAIPSYQRLLVRHALELHG